MRRKCSDCASAKTSVKARGSKAYSRTAAKAKLVLALVCCSLLLSSCGGDRRVLSGVFLITAVQGLSYETESQSGVTDAEGTFTYRIGEQVTFSLGSVVIGSAFGDDVITPLDLFDVDTAEDQRAINVTRFLVVLDSDYQTGVTTGADDGITIPDSFADQVVGVQLDFDQAASLFIQDSVFSKLVLDLTGDQQRAGEISSADIQDFLEENLEIINATSSDVPVVNAGANQTVSSGEEVTLSASATDDGTVESGKWSQLTGTPSNVLDGVLDSSILFEPTITFDAPTVTSQIEFLFQFTATDDDNNERSGTVTITVQP